MKFKNILFACVLLFGISEIHAQTTWDKIFPDALIGFSIGVKVKSTSDGGYIIAGETDLATGAIRHYIRLLKTDAAGNLEWEYFHDELDVTAGEVHFLDTLPNGEFIVGGMHNGLPLLIKIDAEGQLVWEKTYMDSSNHQRYIKSGVSSPDDGYLLVGYAQEDFGLATEIPLIKIDEAGNLEWEKRFNSLVYMIAKSVEVTADGGYILAVEKDNHITLMKIDSLGNLEWEKNYQFSNLDVVQTIKPTPDGGFIVGGSIQGINSSVPFIFKTDSLGNGEWTKTLLGDATKLVTDIVLTNDGGYAVVGSINSFFSTIPGGFFLKLDSSGNAEWSENYESEDQKIAALSTTPDGGYILTGYAIGGLLLKKIGGTTTATFDKMNASLFRVFPNPMQKQTFFEIKTLLRLGVKEVQLQIFDGVGRLVREEKHDSTSFIFYKKTLSSGIYFYKIKNGNVLLENGKLVIVD